MSLLSVEKCIIINLWLSWMGKVHFFSPSKVLWLWWIRLSICNTYLQRVWASELSQSYEIYILNKSINFWQKLQTSWYLTNSADTPNKMETSSVSLINSIKSVYILLCCSNCLTLVDILKLFPYERPLCTKEWSKSKINY